MEMLADRVNSRGLGCSLRSPALHVATSQRKMHFSLARKEEKISSGGAAVNAAPVPTPVEEMQ